MKLFLFSLLCFCFFVFCQKEYSLQNDGPAPSAVADFSFAGGSGACTVATIGGYYATGTGLTTDNTVTIQNGRCFLSSFEQSKQIDKV